MAHKGVELVVRYWRAQHEDIPSPDRRYATTAAKGLRGFEEQAWDLDETAVTDIEQWIAKRPESDLYFSARIFGEPRRSNEAALPSRFLYADIDDGGDPDKEKGMVPWLLWSTSPDMYQGIWQTQEVWGAEDHSTINRWWTYYCGFDRGGWSGSKLLRIPITANWKRQTITSEGFCVPVGTIVSESNRVNLVSPAVGQQQVRPSNGCGEAPKPLSKEDWNAMVADVWKDLPLSVKACLEMGVVADRSLFLYRFYRACKEGGLTPETTFELAHPMPWNKWRSPRELWEDINRAW